MPKRLTKVLHYDYLSVFGSYILVLKDDFSSFIWLYLFDKTDAENTVQAIMNWIMLFGAPLIHVSDRGSHFRNEVVRRLNQIMHTNIHYVHAHFSWANGTSENANKQIRKLMRAMCSETKANANKQALKYLVPVINYSLNRMDKLLPKYSLA